MTMTNRFSPVQFAHLGRCRDILVIGGLNGFIGSNTTEAWFKAGNLE